MNNAQNKYTQLIMQERQRQDEKWGADRDQHNFVWQTILVEEVGEAAECALNEDVVNLEKELIQCAAVIMAWLENLNAKAELHGLQAVEQLRAADGLESEPKCYCPADGIYPGCPVHGNRRR